MRRHHVDTKPFNALFINGLSNLVDIGSFQPRSTSHAVLARDQETTTTQIDGEELEAAQIEHKASEHHEAIDAFSSWLKELIEMGGDNMKDFVGN